jgi:hypothetical protein
MRVHGLYGLALAGLFLLAPMVRAADADSTTFKPTVLVRIKALEELIADARYLVKAAGRENEARQVERMLKARTGPKGLEGIDIKKPIGVYGTVAAKLDESQVVLLLPIADEATFLAFLENVDLKPEKDKSGLYTLQLPNSPFPVEFRFASNYLFGAVKFSDKAGLPDKDKLPDPATVLAGGSGILSVTANVDRLPAQIRKVAISSSSLHLANLKDQAPEGESAAHKAFRESILDEAAVLIKSVLTDGGPVMFQLDVDRKANDLFLSASFAGKPGSPLAKDISVLGKAKSVSAALAGKDSALGGFLHLSAPEKIRKTLGPLVDELVKHALDSAEPGAAELLKPLAEALKPTAKEGTLDVGMSIRGPAKNGKFTLVSSIQVTDGEAIAKALEKVIDKLPEDAKKPIKLNVDRAEGVRIHQITPPHIEAQAKELFGEGPVFFAVRKDALIVTAGEKALETLKSALAVEARAGGLVQVEVSLSRLAKQIAVQNKAAPEAAKKAFTEEGSDKVRLSITAGNRIEVKFNVKTAVITFGSLMEKAKQAAEEKEN